MKLWVLKVETQAFFARSCEVKADSPYNEGPRLCRDQFDHQHCAQEPRRHLTIF